MLAWWVGLGLLWLWQATRKRLARAEQRLNDQAQLLAALAAEQHRVLARLALAEQRLSERAAAPPEAAALGPAGEREPAAIAHEAVSPLDAAALGAPESAGAAHGDRAAADAAAVPAAASPPMAADTPQAALPTGLGQGASASRPQPLDVLGAQLRELVFGGNTLVRVGVMILLVGVVLLLRWAAEHSLFPIELRLAGTALGALALTAFGFKTRRQRPGFALSLQGGGLAALYFVVCFAFRSYGLLPAWLAFVLLVALSVACGVLSVVQDSLALIIIAELCAFAAPLFASSGRGDHVALFSYYLVLNVLVFGVALFKAWRPLNLIGFVFTFGVATAWGVLSYDAALFASTEPFLIAFFALYVAIPVLFALRHRTSPRGWVDGGLVFGTPLSALALQWSLVHDRPFAMAFSALAVAGVYIGLAAWIKRSGRVRLDDLAQAYLPIGVGFATLAVPYALDDSRLTGATWALEGAGLYWVGVRQTRWLSRVAGVVLQLAAGVALGLHPTRAPSSLPLANSWFLSNALVAASGLFIACHAYRQREVLAAPEWKGLQLLILWGLGFWLRAGYGEVDAWTPSRLDPGAQICLLGLSACALELIARRAAWTPGRVPVLGLWPAMLYFLGEYALSLDAQPLSFGGWFGWPAVALAMLLVLREFAAPIPGWLRAHSGAVWLWALWVVVLCEQVVSDGAQLDASYGASLANLSLALWVLAIMKASRSSAWPSAELRVRYLREAAAGLLIIGAYRSALANLTLPVRPAPLPYLPVLNPLDLSSLIGAAVALLWVRRLRGEPGPLCTERSAQWLATAVYALLFAWWNAQLCRSVHHYGGVPFDADALFESSALQLAVSLSWTSIALAVMWFAHVRELRVPWFVAAGLLAVVVAKLFLLDLSQLSTPAKIMSFLGVGLLLLLIGYVAPVPPRRTGSGPPSELKIPS